MARRIIAWLHTSHATRLFVLLHLLLIAALYLRHGIADDKEALKYLGCARDVLQGDLTDLLGNYLRYGAYVLFLLPFIALGLPKLAIVVQVLLGIMAAFALGRMATRISGLQVVGTIATGLLLVCYPVQQWTLALYTESFFTSMAILFMERITREERPDAWTFTLALITVFARPVGMFFVGPALLWKALQLPAFSRMKLLLPVGYAAVLLVAISLPGIHATQLEEWAKAHVIAGFPQDEGAVGHFEGSSILSAQAFLVQRHGFMGAMSLGWQRMVSLYSLARPYYSKPHQLVLLFWMLIYPFTLWGIWCMRKHSTVQLLVSVLVLNTLLVGLTHDEWSGRFVVPLLPLVILLAASATVSIAPLSRQDTVPIGVQ